jgi:hypothetical protein
MWTGVPDGATPRRGIHTATLTLRPSSFPPTEIDAFRTCRPDSIGASSYAAARRSTVCVIGSAPAASWTGGQARLRNGVLVPVQRTSSSGLRAEIKISGLNVPLLVPVLRPGTKGKGRPLVPVGKVLSGIDVAQHLLVPVGKCSFFFFLFLSNSLLILVFSYIVFQFILCCYYLYMLHLYESVIIAHK